jgi:peptidoglycan/xylan/chitin deacetylase (PgdA/CDA1 family)
MARIMARCTGFPIEDRADLRAVRLTAPRPRPRVFDQETPEELHEHRRRILRRRLLAAGVLAFVLVALSAFVATGGHHRAAAGAYRPIVAPPTELAAEAVRDGRLVHGVLGYTPYITGGTARKREVALTFDDGPGPFTPQVVAVLRAHHTPATFFVVGQSLHDFGAYLRLELRPGFVIGDHTENHRYLSLLSRRDQRTQLMGQVTELATRGAPYPHLFRPPYGAFNASTLALLHRYGMLMVLWSVDTRDYRQPGVAVIVQRALAGARPGAIILMHDAGGQRRQTVAALPLIIAGLRRRHLVPVTVPQLLQDDPPPAGQPPPHPLAGGVG